MGLWVWWVLGAVAVTLFVLGTTVGPALYSTPYPIAFPASLVLGGSIVLALLRPIIAAVLACIAIVVTALSSAHGPWPWPAPVVTILALCVLVIVLALSARWWVPVGTWLVAITGLSFVAAESGTTSGASTANLVVAASVSFAALAIGLLLRLWSAAAADLGAARAEVQQEHEARTWAEERQRVAREMHDVVAHSMSLVHMRATSARYRIDGLPEAASAEFDGIAEQARTALAEMRGVLGVLRGDDSAELAPQPGLADLAALVERASSADLAIEAELHPIEPPPVDTVQLALYRVAQEAIANVVRHAPGASVRVELAADERIRLTITSTGGTPGIAPDRGGSGIRGMIDRMTAIGGSLAAGPIGGGFEVVAIAPRST